MWTGHRQSLIDGHRFYVGQAKSRLLSQFQNIEDEAEKYSNEWLEKASHDFDPDRHDPADFYEQSHEEGIEFYQLLDEMRNRTRLSVVAGFFHEWDKQLRGWIVKEVNHWHSGNETKSAVWKAKFIEIVELFECLGWEIKSQSFYAALDRCRLVVNAYKHGDGVAFNDIKRRHSDLLKNFGGSLIDMEFFDHSDLMIAENHIDEFSDAVIRFWESIPEYIFNGEKITAPSWFEKAIKRDVDKKVGAEAKRS